MSSYKRGKEVLFGRKFHSKKRKAGFTEADVLYLAGVLGIEKLYSYTLILLNHMDHKTASRVLCSWAHYARTKNISFTGDNLLNEIIERTIQIVFSEDFVVTPKPAGADSKEPDYRPHGYEF